MNGIGFTIPYLVGLVLNDPQISLQMKAVPQSHQEMEIDLQGTSPAVQELRKDTSPEVIEEVTSYVLGGKEFDASKITEDTIFSYLAAAKIVDLTIPADQQIHSTLAVRDACLAEPTARSKHTQITLLNGYIIPQLTETRLQFLNRFDDLKDVAVRRQQREVAMTTAYFHRDTLPRIESVFKRAVGEIAHSTQYLKDRNVFFAGASGVGKSTTMKKFVEDLAGQPVDLQDIVYGTDNFKVFLREEFPTCQDQPSFVLAMALRLKLEAAVKTHAAGSVFFLQEGVLSNEALVHTLLKDTKLLEIRDFDAPFKSIAMRSLNREHHRGERAIQLTSFAADVASTRKVRTIMIASLSDGQSYVMNYDGRELTAEDMKTFKYDGEPEDLSVIGDERITDSDVSQFDGALGDYVGLTICEAFVKVNERTVHRAGK